MNNNFQLYAPVVIFAYSRADHLRATIESLLANPEAKHSELIVYSDGPRDISSSSGVNEVRQYIDALTGFSSIRRIYRENNLGLANSIITGVTEVLNEFEVAIILEDDLVLSPHFLRFMNDGLNCYRDDLDVASIHGYWYPVSEEMPETFFLKGADCWGWGTWRRAWNMFEPDGKILLDEIKKRRLSREFDYMGTYPFTRMLIGQISGRNNSWAIRWHASCYLKGALTLFPGKSLVNNIGHDGSGEHCGVDSTFSTTPTTLPVLVHRVDIKQSENAFNAMVNFFRRTRVPTYIKLLRYFQKN